MGTAVVGHAAFLAAQPEPGVRLETSPAQVSLAFSEPRDPRLTRGELVSLSDGGEIDVAIEASAKRLVLRPKRELRQGAYSVNWHTVLAWTPSFSRELSG